MAELNSMRAQRDQLAWLAAEYGCRAGCTWPEIETAIALAHEEAQR